MDSTDKFKNAFMKVLQEDISSATAFGIPSQVFEPPGSITSTDSYAPGDARIPFDNKVVQTRKGKVKKKKKKKKFKLIIK